MELSMIIASITRRFDFDLEYPGQQVSAGYFWLTSDRTEPDICLSWKFAKAS
jgi:hypothetical protein